MQGNIFEWNSHEHVYTEKSSDWYWAVGIITVSAAVTAVIFHNVLFAILIILGAIALTMHATKEPPLRHYQLTTKGLVVDDHFFSYENLESFWVEEDFIPHSILFKSKKYYMPLMVVHLPDDINPDDVREYLSEHLPLVERREPVLHKLLEYLGF